MSPRASGRTAECDRADARSRLRHAESFLVVADLVLEQPGEPQISLTSVAASLAVLAGIAAADAACCARLRVRARGPDHRKAVDLLRTVEPQGELMARDLGRLLALKDDAHYGVIDVAVGEARTAVDRARRLLDLAREAAG